MVSKKGIVTIVTIAIFAVLVYALDLNGPKWQAMDAKTKLNTIWAHVTENRNPADFPSTFKLLELFIESMDSTFDTISDDLPYQGPLGLVRRAKLIHGVGVIAQIKWRSVGSHPYTGIFKGSSSAVARLSWAKAVDFKDERPYLPGVAFKFLRDRRKSANFMAMTSLLGVDTPNFFANDVTNHVPDLGDTSPLLIKKLKSTFQKASNWPVFLGLSDVARYDEHGNEEANPVFPFRLIFHAGKDIRSLMETKDQPTDLPSYFMSKLTQPRMEKVWSVWAEAFPEDPHPIKIAEIDFTSPVIASEYSDKALFFQHQRMEDDFRLKPEWVSASLKQTEKQRSVEYYTYPNRDDEDDEDDDDDDK